MPCVPGASGDALPLPAAGNASDTSVARISRRPADGVSVTKTEKWWAMTCGKCGGFVPIRAVEVSERVPPQLDGKANCVRCHELNTLTGASLFVIDGTRLRRIRLSSPSDYVK